MAEQRKANANPTKAFFVRMITRDIFLTDCIFDLIDNCVDGAWQLEGSKPISLANGTDLSRYKIEIEASAERFSIKDNCGGISLDAAVNYAFTFGRKEEMAQERYSIGVYGIGMKRAVFKLGNNIQIHSTHKKRGAKVESFIVPISVPKWLEDSTRNWDFDLEDATPLPHPGVHITVMNLNEGAQEAFGSPLFMQNLRRAIARDYALHLHRGLSITLMERRLLDGKLSSEKVQNLLLCGLTMTTTTRAVQCGWIS